MPTLLGEGPEHRLEGLTPNRVHDHVNRALRRGRFELHPQIRRARVNRRGGTEVPSHLPLPLG